jgi:hypothetical protein
MPAHVGQLVGRVPALAPDPPHVSHETLDVVAQVGAALAAGALAPAAAAAAHELAEEVVENIRHRGGEVGTKAASHAAVEGGVAELVVGGALLGIF